MLGLMFGLQRLQQSQQLQQGHLNDMVRPPTPGPNLDLNPEDDDLLYL